MAEHVQETVVRTENFSGQIGEQDGHEFGRDETPQGCINFTLHKATSD
jgi:hypothetical protein